MPRSKRDTCINCKFHGNNVITHTGGPGVECRRHAPIADTQRSNKPIYPEVPDGHWCGDFKREA